MIYGAVLKVNSGLQKGSKAMHSHMQAHEHAQSLQDSMLHKHNARTHSGIARVARGPFGLFVMQKYKQTGTFTHVCMRTTTYPHMLERHGEGCSSTSGPHCPRSAKARGCPQRRSSAWALTTGNLRQLGCVGGSGHFNLAACAC